GAFENDGVLDWIPHVLLMGPRLSLSKARRTLLGRLTSRPFDMEDCEIGNATVVIAAVMTGMKPPEDFPPYLSTMLRIRRYRPGKAELEQYLMICDALLNESAEMNLDGVWGY